MLEQTPLWELVLAYLPQVRKIAEDGGIHSSAEHKG